MGISTLCIVSSIGNFTLNVIVTKDAYQNDVQSRDITLAKFTNILILFTPVKGICIAHIGQNFLEGNINFPYT